MPEIKAPKSARQKAHRQIPEIKAAAKAYMTMYRQIPEVQSARWRRSGMPLPTRSPPDRCENTGCLTPLPYTRALANEHCHATGKFRGWLCGPCNSALRRLGDDLLAFDQMTKGLREYLARTSHIAWMDYEELAEVSK
jgi:hypothetical protein